MCGVHRKSRDETWMRSHSLYVSLASLYIYVSCLYLCGIYRESRAAAPCNSIDPLIQDTASLCSTLQHTLQRTASYYPKLQHILYHTTQHCSTLQHTATHCNTLQHTATHCTTLQHTATHCNTLHHTTPHSVAQCTTPAMLCTSTSFAQNPKP